MLATNQRMVVLEGKKIKTEKELHNFLKDKLELPHYYGMNLDALWDCITGHIALPIKIVWNDFEQSKEILGKQLTDSMITLFKDAKKELGRKFDYELK